MAKKVKKAELGKGIRAIFSSMDQAREAGVQNEEAVKELNKTIAMIPLDLIVVNPFQPRSDFQKDALEELARSIQQHGLIQPITLRRLSSEQFQIISGERRFRAAKTAGLEQVPAYIRVADDQAMLEMALVENIQRKDLNPIEIAISYQRLMNECELTHEELALRVSKNRSTITNYVRLLRLPPEIQKAVKSDKISMGHARAIAGIAEPERQLSIFQQVLSNNLSVRKLEEIIRDIDKHKPIQKKSTPTYDPALSEIKESLVDYYNTKVDIQRKDNGKGKIIFHFNDNNELNDILDLLKDE